MARRRRPAQPRRPLRRHRHPGCRHRCGGAEAGQLIFMPPPPLHRNRTQFQPPPPHEAPPPRCYRTRPDCEPLHAIEALPAEMTDLEWEALETGAMTPASFVCAGCVSQAARGIPQDAYRVCWKNNLVDEIGDYDEQDFAH